MNFKNLNERIEFFLEERKKQNTYRSLSLKKPPIDFSSNDYLGLSRSSWIKQKVKEEYEGLQFASAGATGSRLLNGNSKEMAALETQLADFFDAESALIFNSGFDANLGLISTVAREGDLILYDELIHASLHQGIRLSKANSKMFKHNDVKHLEGLLKQKKEDLGQVFVVLESVYSMDGDKAPLINISQLKQKYDFNLIVDEAHAIGVFGEKGRGLVGSYNLEKQCFARIVTFGKALGAHGACVLGSKSLRYYLINYCKGFIYTTATSLHNILRIKYALFFLEKFDSQCDRIANLMAYFKNRVEKEDLHNIVGDGPIFGIVIPNADKVKYVAEVLQSKGLDIRPIVAPTVEKGKERLRISIHSFNSKEEIDQLFEELSID